MTKNELITTVGFLLFIFGCLSIILSSVGLDFSFLIFLSSLSPIASFVIKMSIAILGLVLTYLGTKGYYNP